MAKNIAGYITNLGKSVSYSAVDKMKTMSPSSAEFVETNADLFKTVYNSVRDYKITYKRGMDIFSKSKIYEAGDVFKTSLMQDIKSGKLYNKEREDKMAMKAMGMDSSPDMDMDFNFDDIDNMDFGAEDITSGDRIVSSAIDSSSRKTAEMISTVTARTGEYIVENQRMTTNLLYTQNMQTHSMLNGNLTSINENISNIINFSDKVMKVHVENSTNYYQETTKLMQDQTALLRELVTLMRPTEKKEENKKQKITYDDLVGANGMPDLKLYLKNVKNNSQNVAGLGMLSSMNSMFGEDSNVLATLAASPLKFIPEAIINTLVPKTIETSMQNLDKSLSAIFGSMVTKFNTMAASDNMIESTIGNLLGVRSQAKDDIDSSKYEKGKVDWDGKSRKALIEVIPTQLGKIVSLLSGQKEKLYDYEKGKFITGEDIESEYERKKKGYSDSATNEMKEYMQEYAKLMTFNSLAERKKFEEDMDKFFNKLYSENKLFDVNSATLDQDHMDYGMDSKNFRAVRTMYKKAPKYMQHQINAEILDNRNRQTRDFEELEKNGTSVLQYMFNGSNIDEYIKKNKLDKTSSSPLTSTLTASVDDYGRNIFFYLQNIFKELSYMRQYGKQGNDPDPNSIKDPMKIVASDGSTYSPQEKTIKDIAIPRNPRKPRADEEIEKTRREEERFRRSELNRRKHDQDLVNYSDEDDDRLLGARLALKIDEDRVNRRVELESSRKPSLIDKLLEAKNLSEKSRIMIDKITELTKKPTEFVTSTIEKVDQRMYEFIYGKEDQNGNDIKGFFDLTLYELRNTFSKFNNFMDEKILTPLKEKLDVDSLKGAFDKFLNKLGIDTNKIGKSVKTFFFGDKDQGKEGILSSTIDATKRNFKGAYNTAKDSVKSVVNPIKDKIKPKLRSRRQSLLDDMDLLDEQGEDYVDNSINPIQDRINKVTGISNNSGKSQAYYDNIDWDNDYLDKYTYLTGRKSQDDNRVEMYYLNERIKELQNESRGANSTRAVAITTELQQLMKRRDFLKSNILDFHKSKNRYKKKLSEKKYNNINNYYKKSISSALGFEDENEDFNTVMDNLFGDKPGKADFTIEDFMKSARKLSLNNMDGEKYEDILDKMANYTDKYYGSDISKKLSIVADDSGKLYDPESFRSEGLPKTAEEYYEMSSDFNGGKNLMKEVEDSNKSLDTHTTLLQGILDNIKSLNDFFGNLKNNNRPQTSNLGPRMNLNPDLVRTPEGRATHSFAQDLVTMISNWMYGNTQHFDKGGYIHKPMVATVGEGEIVLSADNVDKMTSVFSDIVGNVKKKEKTKAIASGTLDKLLNETDLNMNNFEELEQQFRNSKNYASMSGLEKKKYGKVINFVNSNSQEQEQQRQLDNESLVVKVKDELLSGTKAVTRSLFGEPKEDSKKFGEVVSDVTGNISTYAPDMIGKGLVGAGISLVTGAIGGPLLGAAVGAGISLTKNSDKVQDMLFGKMKDGEREGGLISKNILQGAKKYLPDMKTYGITGTLAGFLTPLGPVGGLILGSSIGFAKNNESVMSTLFGQEGLFKSESKDKLKKALPKVAAGALVGGMVGPFGLLGNLVLGSGIGLATSTEDFKTAILGRYDEKDKEFKGGIIPMMRDTILKPLQSFGTDIKNGAMDYIKKNMLLPVTNAMDPIKKEISLLAKGAFDKVSDFLQNMFKETFAPLNKWVEDKIMKPVGGTIVKFIKGAFKGGVGLATLPFKAIGGVGNSLRKKHIKNGNADYMTAEERMGYASEKGIRYNTGFDEYLNSISDEEADSIYEKLASIKNSGKSAKKLRKQKGKEVGNMVSTYVDYDTTKELMYHFRNGNMDKAEELLRKNKKGLRRKKRHDLNRDQQQELLDYMRNNYDGYHNADERQEQLDAERQDLYKTLRKKGFKDISDDNVDKYLGMLNKERKSDKNKKTKVDENDPSIGTGTKLILERQKERHNEIVVLFQDAIKAIKGIEENTETPEDRKTSKNNNGFEDSDNNSVTDRIKNESNKSRREPIIKIDEHGNVMEFKRGSDGELKPDKSDSSTLAAIQDAEREDDTQQSILDALKNMNGRGGDEEEDEKKKGGIFALLGGLLKGFTKFFNPKMLGLLGTAVMAIPVIPDLVKAVTEDGISGLATAIPSLVLNGVKRGITEVLPATMKGFWDMFNGREGDDDSPIENVGQTAVREVATGGKLGKVGLSTYDKAANSISIFGKANKIENKAARIVSKGVRLMSPLTYMKAGTKASLHTVPKMAAKPIGAAAKSVGSLYNKIDNKTGLAKISDAAKTKVGAYMEKTSNAIGDQAIGKAVKAEDATIISKFIKNMSEFFSKLLSNPVVSKLIGPEALEKMSKEFVPNFLKQLSERMMKESGKIAAKVAGALATGGLINIAFAIGDFISGYNDAQDILGISENPTIGMKIASGLLKSINGFFIITSFIPEKIYVNLVLDTLLPIFGKNDSKLQNMRKDAKARAAQYKKENNIKGSFSVQDYNKKIKDDRKKANPADRNGDGKVSTFEKIKNSVSSTWDKTKKFGSGVLTGIGNAASTVGNAISGVASSIWKGMQSFGNWLVGKGGDSSETAGMGNAPSGTNYPSRMNNFTYYSQGDPRWNTEPIGGTTVKRAGCGPTSMAMIVSELTGQAHHPDEMVKDALAHGQWSSNGANWTMFKYFADKFNLPYQEAGSYEKFQQMASQGIPQAVSGKKRGIAGSPFTNGGHIITVLGVDSNGNYIVNDPVSPERSKPYPNDIIQKGWRNSWGFGGAGTYNSSGVGQNTYGAAPTEQPQAQEQESGLSMLFSDFTKASINSVDKLYGFDKINQSTTTTAPTTTLPVDNSQTQTAGQGGEDAVNLDTNQYAATDFEDKGVFNKIKSMMKKAPLLFANKVTSSDGKDVKSFTNIKADDKSIADLRNKLLDESAKYTSKPKYNGMGGDNDTEYNGMGSGDTNTTTTATPQELEHQDLTKFTDISEDQFNQWLGTKKKSTKPFTSTDANIFLNAANKTGLDPRYIMAHAAWESGWGQSRIARDKNNYYGIGAFNKSPYSSALSFKTASDGILAGAEWIKKNYTDRGQNTLHKMIFDPSGKKHTYATFDNGAPNTDWIKGITGIMSSAPQSGKIVTSLNTSAPGAEGQQQQGEQRSGFDGLMADLGDLLTGGFNKLYGLDEIFGSNNTSDTQSDPSGAGIDPNAPKISDDWYTKTLGARISSPYGNRKNPTGSGNQFHKGIDYATAAGTNIKSPIDGVVESNESSKTGFGNLLKVKDSMGSTHYFAHMQQRSPLKEGTRVKSGDIVGKIGSTGNSTGPHLHYQVNTSSDRNSHTEPNGYLAKLFGKLKNTNGQGGGNETKTKSSNKYNGQGGEYETVKTPKLPNFSRRGNIPKKDDNNTSGLSDTKLLSIIIEVLSKIADNTSSLSEIVQILSKSLNVDIPEDSIKQMKSNKNSIKGGNKQMINIIKNSIKDTKNPENAQLMATLDKLAME